MPSIEDRVDEIHPAKGNLTLDCTDAGTQPFKFDSQSSHSDILGKKFNEDFDELRFLQSTLPFYDTLPLEDPLQTQMMSLAGETQVLDDIDNIELMETQILDEFDDVVATDSQGSDKTEVLGETEECIDDYFMKREGVCPVDQESKLTEVLGETEEYFDDYFMNREGVGPMDQESKLCHALSKQDDGGFQAGSDGLINGQYSSALDLSTTRLSDKDTPETKPGSKQRNFTTVRVAALRASGLAAQGVSSKGAVNASHFLNSDSQSSKQYDAEDKNETDIQDSWVFEEGVDQEDFQREPNKTPNGNQGRIDGLTMRKLSIEEKLSKADAGADLDQLPACGYEMAGLSYVDSQEPGELSEADALHFVDKFLEANIMDFEQEVDIVRPVGGKSKSVSSTLGNQNLAKRTNLKRVYAQRGVFDWDDSREDEGGGEFLTKMKETFFDEGGQWQKSVTPSQKLRLTDCRASGVADETRDKEKRLDICTKAKRLFISNPRRLSKKARPNEKMNLKSQTKFRKDMPKKMDKLPEVGSSGVKAIGSMDLPKKIEVGFDTQIAAKAMEALCFGSAVAHCDDKDISQHIKNKHEVYRKIGEKNRAKSTKEYLQERPNSSNSRVLTRNQAKTIGTIKSEGLTVPSRKHAKNARATLNGHTSTNQIQNIDKAPSEVSKKIEVRAMRRKSLDHVDRCHAVASSSVNKSIKRSYMEDQVAIFAPIAHRTRQQRSANQERAGIESNYRDGIHQAEASKRRQRISSDVAFTKLSNEEKFLKSGSNQSSCLENTKSAEREKLQKKLTENNSHTSLAGENARSEVSPGDICRPSDLATATPANCTTPICSTSPVCKGDEYLKLSCRKNLSKEINGLISNMSEPTSPPKDSRKRKDLTIAQVLFSRHLDEDIIKQQKKILARLGASVALSMSEATHFITDKFVRTRNMLEAIACGKAVVTHLWLQSCERASCFIDERNYILRDTTKEKEFGFSLAVSLGRACQHPLLQGLRVFVTPNTKPSREILVSLVKATHGLAMERIGRSAFKEDKVPDDLLVLSCEEDYALCVPFLQKGAAVYSSELLLNGIVTQKLEYGRHRLFIDHVKRTRSTLWLKEDGNRYQPVKRLK